ncbi:MAG: immunoglobulin domain-containing protein [Verrucomicrobiota bacterium]
MKRITILTILATVSLCLGASAASLITQWNFNSNPADANTATGTLSPSVGSGSAAIVGTVVTTYNPGSPSDTSTATDNTGWRTATYPPQGTGNKTCGVQFNFSTAGYDNITLSWDQANSAGANKYYRVQYSIDGGSTWTDKDVVINAQTVGNTWNSPIATISFNGVSGASQNPNFAVRIVSEWESTAVGGSDVYVPVTPTSTYSTTAFLRLDLVTFSGDVAVGGQVEILTQPTNQVVAVGQPASFQVIASGGTTPIKYQWRKDGTPILNATNSTYSIASAQFSDAGSYIVVVSNSVNSVTSSAATLTVRTALNLAWTGVNSAFWDSITANWVNTADSTTVAYAGGDHVLFDSRGASAPVVSLTESLTPSSVTVQADFDYTLRSTVGGKIAGATGLKKMGAGTLVLNTDNIYSGATVIEAGTLQLGAADDRGSMGSGSITNISGLVFNRADNIVISNAITSSGGLTNLGKGVTLSGGANTYSGPIAVLSGTLTLSGNQTVTSSDVVISPAAPGITDATRLALASGIVVSSGTTIHMSGTTPVGDLRLALAGSGGSAVVNGPIVLDGSWVNSFYADDTAQFVINGNVSADPTFSGVFFLRGNLGFGTINGTMILPGIQVNKTDTGTWTFNSTGNDWGGTAIAVGTLRIGAHNALPTTTTINMGQASAKSVLDLAGYNQRIAGLSDVAGTRIITNSSATADSILTIGSGAFGGIIVDSVAGRKTGLTIDGSTFTLSALCSYSGNTTVQAGTLALSGAGAIPNSAVIDLVGGGIDVSARSDAKLTLSSGQTLKGNGTLSITGNLVNGGTIELDLNKSGGVATYDKLAVSGQLTSGGTLKLILSGEALSSADVLDVFTAGSFNGTVPTINPAAPAPGTTWNTSTLLTDGKLRIAGANGPIFNAPVFSGSNIILSGSGGTPFATYSVVTSTNIAAPAATWTPVQSGSFDANGNFSVSLPITSGEPQRFYMLKLP